MACLSQNTFLLPTDWTRDNFGSNRAPETHLSFKSLQFHCVLLWRSAEEKIAVNGLFSSQGTNFYFLSESVILYWKNLAVFHPISFYWDILRLHIVFIFSFIARKILFVSEYISYNFFLISILGILTIFMLDFHFSQVKILCQILYQGVSHAKLGRILQL